MREVPHTDDCRSSVDRITDFRGVALDQPCDRCKGYGHSHYPHANGSSVYSSCSRCEGTGLTPTEDGKALLDFLDKYAPKPSLQYG